MAESTTNEDGAEIQLGDTTLRFISTPGHTPGQGCYYNDTDIIVGDTLFAGSIGRTDFPLSNPQKMVEACRPHQAFQASFESTVAMAQSPHSSMSSRRTLFWVHLTRTRYRWTTWNRLDKRGIGWVNRRPYVGVGHQTDQSSPH